MAKRIRMGYIWDQTGTNQFVYSRSILGSQSTGAVLRLRQIPGTYHWNLPMKEIRNRQTWIRSLSWNLL